MIKNTIIPTIYTFIINPILTLIIGVNFENKSSLRGQQQFLIVANHNSHLDALSILAAIPYSQFRKVHTVVAADYFGKNRLCKIFVKLFFNAVFINRNSVKNEPSSIEILDHLLKQGKSLILFPEGSRGVPGVVTDFKKGAAILLQRNPHIHFIPAHLNGFGRVLPKGSSVIIPLNCKVRFGQPMRANTVNINALLDQIKQAIFSLKPISELDTNNF